MIETVIDYCDMYPRSSLTTVNIVIYTKDSDTQEVSNSNTKDSDTQEVSNSNVFLGDCLLVDKSLLIQLKSLCIYYVDLLNVITTTHIGDNYII